MATLTKLGGSSRGIFLCDNILFSFLGGVMSSSLVWWYFGLRSKSDSGGASPRGPRDPDHPEKIFFLSRWLTLEDLKDSLDDLRNRIVEEFPGSLGDLKSRISDLSGPADDIKNRIGELPVPTRRSRWPWDRLRAKKKKTSDDPTKPDDDGNKSKNMESTEAASKVKSDLCIGSIFGLDVGGTLAKLVYFEQKTAVSSTTESIGLMSHRERYYRNAASAQTVLMARRGLVDSPRSSHWPASSSHDDLKNATNDQHFKRPRRRTSTYSVSTGLNGLKHSKQSNDDLQNLTRLRQESVPDDLDAYAETVHLKSDPDRVKKDNLASGHGGQDLRSDADDMNTDSNDKHQSRQKDVEPSAIRKSRSMLNLNLNRAEALDHFYNFARRLDSYREGVKDDKLSFYSRELQGDFHFIRFETRRMQQAVDLIRTNNLHVNIREMGATGGGAHKFATKWEEELGITMKKQEELDSLVAGMQFVLSTVVGECYSFRPAKDKSGTSPGETSSTPATSTCGDDAPSSEKGIIDEDGALKNKQQGGKSGNFESEYDSDGRDSPNGGDRGSGDEWWWSRKVRRDAISYSSTYPYLVVSIGTGVSILRVDGPRKYERISGSTIGGGTYWGLIRLLTDVEDFDDVMRLAARGDPSKVDMMVGDIYGQNSDALEKLGLPANVVASSFGKLVSKEDPAAGVAQEDLARALLLMITNNIGQVAYLNAKLSKTRRIYFVGNFLRENKISQRRLSFAIDYWSKGEMEALFLEHEGYFGALGAFLLSQDITQFPGEPKRGDFQRSFSMHVKPDGSPYPSEDTESSASSSAAVSSPHRRTSTMAYM
jgi:pantothenate kinase